MRQPRLFRGHQLPSVYRYGTVFEHLPAWPCAPNSSGRGRKPYAPDLLLKALIYRALRRIPTLSELALELQNNPSLADCLGLDPWHTLPSIQRFSSFLRSTPNPLLQQVRCALLHRLMDEHILTGRIVALDSCPVEVPLRENNPKAGSRSARFDKTRPPQGDPQAGLGVCLHYPRAGEKKVAYFWGYRNHTLTDADSELPLLEQTHPAHKAEVRCAASLLQDLQALPLQVQFVTADAQYDSEALVRCIVEKLRAQPIVAHNPRSEQNLEFSIRKGQLYCAADLAMAHRGKMTHSSTGITYRQYSCPLHWRKNFQQRYLLCPIAHPKFFQQKGCNLLIRLTPGFRSQIPYGTELYQTIYAKRTAIERSYSRLLTLTLQDPTVRGLQAVQNHCTIAHIATLLIALTACTLGQKDKIRWIKSLVPKFLKN